MKEPFDLENRLRQHPFQVPEGYFDELPQQIGQRVQQPLPAANGVLAWLQLYRGPLAAVACSLVIALALLFRQAPQSAYPVAPVTVQELSQAEIVSYLSTSFQPLEAADLAAYPQIEKHLPTAPLKVQPLDVEDQLDYETVEEYVL